MNFQQIRETMDTLTQGLPALFSKTVIEFYFCDEYIPIGDWSRPEKMGVLVTGDGIGSKSGVYFFGSPMGEVYYFGKATKNNLHHRVWDHIKTPEIMTDGKRNFPKHHFSKVDAADSTACILNGDARLGVITVSEPELVSLIEVYLQTLHAKNFGKLPPLNKRIG